MATRLVDLHSHSTVSDGTLSPSEVVALAAERGLAAVALTDHDHVGGIEEASHAAERAGVELVPGVELSVDSAWGSFHMLGYFVDPGSPALARGLAALRAGRDERNPIIVRRLRDLGFDITMAEVEREAGGLPGKSVARPHIAGVLLRKGYVASIAEAFDKFLAAGRPAYVPRRRFTASEGIRLVRDAGGIAVMAHPVTLHAAAREPALRALAREGLGGVEVWHPKQDAALSERLLAIGEDLGLVATGGSDFHGANKPGIDLGRGSGDLAVPYGVVEALKRVVGRP